MTRVGFGFDLHPLVAGRPLVLGGVKVPSEAGLDGHSDADVLSHAVAEALLGALALGDLGRHFPDTDPRWRGVSSLVLLKGALDLVAARGASTWTPACWRRRRSWRRSCRRWPSAWPTRSESVWTP